MSSFKPKYIAYAMQALGHGLVAILTHILDQEKFDNCCNAPFCINRAPLQSNQEQDLSRNPPHPRSSGCASWSHFDCRRAFF